MAIRLATPKDAAAITAIYTPFVTDTVVTFEKIAPTVAEMAQRIQSTLPQFPYLVWEEQGVVVGYAYAGRAGVRQGFDWSCELSVYLAPAARGKGIGKQLYQALLSLLTAQGYHCAVGRVALPNDSSERLHQALGFAAVGVHEKIGFKRGQWIDLKLYQKQLQPKGALPSTIQPITAVYDSVMADHLRRK